MTNYFQQTESTAPIRQQLARKVAKVSANCTQCQICVNECQFLQRHGDPKTLADQYDPTEQKYLQLPFECSLCELCTAVCPHGVEPPKLFLEMRREAFERGQSDLPEHRSLRSYEKRGTSKRFSWYALPESCDTIFFPGCALAGTRSETTLKVFTHLQKVIPAIGIVLDCCTKPSHDLGDEKYFNAMFGEMKNYLLAQGIKTILLACPNCDKVFKAYGSEFNIHTVYEVLDQSTADTTSTTAEKSVVLHDPCTARFNLPAQDSVRNLLKKRGVEIVQQPHSGQKTVCCGEGGAVNCFKPELAENWSQKRLDEAAGLPIVSYCAGCTQILGQQTKTNHILDVVFNPSAEEIKIAKGALTYFKRLKLKKTLRENLHTAVSRERTFQPYQRKQSGDKNKRAILIATLLLLLPGIFFWLR